MRQEEGFTLVELIVVMVIIGVLLSVAFVFHYGARERSSDATARANIRSAMPAIEAYRSETGGYAGMTVGGLKSTYSAGIGGIAVEWTGSLDVHGGTDAARGNFRLARLVHLDLAHRF